MPAANYDLLIEQGATYQQLLTWKNPDGTAVDLTNWKARLVVKSAYSSPDVTLELTTENGGITLGGVAGTINLLITSAQTAIEDFNGKQVYNLELYQNGNPDYVVRLLQGNVALNPEVAA